MKVLIEKAKIDNQIMKLLKISHIDHKVADTTKGPLVLRLPFEGTSEDYVFVLDSVVQDKEVNEHLFKLTKGILYE